jgi:cytochrome b subunit of formate dehydrogenase
MIGALLSLLVILVIAGLILWALGQFPLDATIAKLIKVVVVVFAVIACIYVLFPLLSAGLSGAHLGR